MKMRGNNQRGKHLRCKTTASTKQIESEKLGFLAIIMWRFWSNLTEAPEMKVRKKSPRIRIRDRSRSMGQEEFRGARHGWMAGYRIATEIRFEAYEFMTRYSMQS